MESRESFQDLRYTVPVLYSVCLFVNRNLYLMQAKSIPSLSRALSITQGRGILYVP